MDQSATDSNRQTVPYEEIMAAIEQNSNAIEHMSTSLHQVLRTFQQAVSSTIRQAVLTQVEAQHDTFTRIESKLQEVKLGQEQAHQDMLTQLDTIASQLQVNNELTLQRISESNKKNPVKIEDSQDEPMVNVDGESGSGGGARGQVNLQHACIFRMSQRRR
jgi:exonuclease VII small subunit